IRRPIEVATQPVLAGRLPPIATASAEGAPAKNPARRALTIPHARPEEPDTQPALSRPAWLAPHGFAAIPTAALDPPHSAASPAVPALIGSGSPSILLTPLRPSAARASRS